MNISNKAISLASHCLSYSHGTADMPLMPYTIGQMLNKTAEKYPDNEMYVFYLDKERFTFREFRNQTHGFAAGLLNLGLQKGDRLAVWGNTHMEFLLAYHACAQIGVIFVRLVADMATEVNIQLVKKFGCKAVVITRTPENGLKEVCKFIPELQNSEPGKLSNSSLPELKIVVAAEELFPNCKSVLTVNDVLRLGGTSDEACERITSLSLEISNEDDFTVFFTSGSTGSPKAVVHCHQALLNSVRMTTTYRPGTHFMADWTTKMALVASPTSMAQECGVLNPVLTGNTAVFTCPTFQADVILKAVAEERCTETILLIHHIYDLANHPDVDQYDWSCMKVVMACGSIIPENLMEAAKAKLTKHIMLGYGTTETCVTSQQSPVDHPDKFASSAMYPDPHIEVKIVDSQGHTVFTNTEGEIQVRSYSMFRRYLGDEEATQNCKTNTGWYKTGDLGIMDNDGFFRILGRQKDVIVKGACTYFPKVLERVLEQHDNVSVAVVFGVPDERLLEEVCACVKLNSSASVDVDALKSFCKGKVHDLMIPEYVFIVSELPTTSTGKFHRKKLREWAISRLNGTASN